MFIGHDRQALSIKCFKTLRVQTKCIDVTDNDIFFFIKKIVSIQEYIFLADLQRVMILDHATKNKTMLI